MRINILWSLKTKHIPRTSHRHPHRHPQLTHKRQNTQHTGFVVLCVVVLLCCVLCVVLCVVCCVCGVLLCSPTHTHQCLCVFGSWFGRTAEQSPLTGCEPSSLIDISSEYTPINFLSRKNSYGTDLNDVPTTAATSDVAGIHDAVYTGERSNFESLKCLCPSASRKRQPAAASSSLRHWVS